MNLPSRVVIVRHAESEGNAKSPNDISFRDKANHNFSLTETGKFQAMMDVELVNDGPVTILLDSKKLF